MLLKELLKNIDIIDTRNYKGDTKINNIVYDSRKAGAGSLFVCIEGFKSDGHKYISQAVDNGTVAVVVQKDIDDNIDIPIIKINNTRKGLALLSACFYKNPTQHFKLIGVTGTNGKTTTTYLIKSILEMNNQKVGLIGTNQNMIGDEIIPTERTTPESLELQQLFSKMLDKNVDTVIMEVSSHSLDLHRVDGCDFDIGIFTNLTQDHLDYHKTMDKYIEAKNILFKKCKKGIVNIDDKYSNYILKNADSELLTFAIDKDADVKAKDIVLSQKGVEFTLCYQDIKQERMSLSIPGKFSVYNALGSIAACIILGVPTSVIKKGLSNAKGVPGRAQVVADHLDYTIIIDYAHTPDGLDNILNTVNGFVKGRVITVFGCGGDRDAAKRPLMGKTAGELSDFCIVTSDNPRNEDPNKIIEDILPGIDETDCEYIIIENRLNAIKHAMKIAKKGDVVVLAGKGHETYQEIKGVKYDFNEESIVRELAQS